MRTLTGVPAAPGSVVAPALVHRHDDLVLPEGPAAVPERDTANLIEHLDGVARELDGAADSASGDARDILRAQAAIARDPALRAAALTAVAGGTSAARALIDAGESFARRLTTTDNAYLMARATDVRHICELAARSLLGLPQRHPPRPVGTCVLIADDLMPIDTASLDPTLVVGIATASGTPTSHTSIVARGLGIPAVVAVPDLLDTVSTGTTVALDGDVGMVHVEPDDATVARLRAAASIQQARHERDRRLAGATPTTTADGEPVEVAANIGNIEDLRVAWAEGAEAVGLLRTELLFVGRDRPPTTGEQTEILLAMRDIVGQHRIVVRTFDIGSDKPVPFLPARPERNPELGVRGIRLARTHPDLLAAQLTAVAALGATGPTAVMAPMVATVDEVTWFRDRAADAELPTTVEVGVMVEVPSAVLLVEEIAELVDFVSVGTNDLGQYLHAADRRHAGLTTLHDPFHPALLRALDLVCRGSAGKCWVGVCGESAADPGWACLAVGLGVTELSMQAISIPSVRATLRRIRLADCRAAAEEACLTTDPASARRVAEELLTTIDRSAPCVSV